MNRMHARFLWSWPLVAAAVLMTPQIASAAVTAAVVGNQLQVTGDGADDSITLRLLAGDATQVEVLDGVVAGDLQLVADDGGRDRRGRDPRRHQHRGRDERP